MDNVPWVLISLFGIVVAFNVGRLTVKSPAEEEMIRRVIKLRADRYIGAVAKMKVEQEIKDAADAQATNRLAEQGVRPTQS
jgi:hypothetical protein